MKCLNFGFALITLLATACSPLDQQPGSYQPTASPDQLETSQTTNTPAIKEAPKMPEPTSQPPEKPITPPDNQPTLPAQLNSFVETARADLAQRLGVSPEEIIPVKFEFVTWPDGSLGCPKPGMAYIQVLVEGYRILLSNQDIVYPYHGGSGTPPFLCEQKPNKQIPSDPIDLGTLAPHDPDQ